jgi:hypothetical protein
VRKPPPWLSMAKSDEMRQRMRRVSGDTVARPGLAQRRAASADGDTINPAEHIMVMLAVDSGNKVEQTIISPAF